MLLSPTATATTGYCCSNSSLLPLLLLSIFRPLGWCYHDCCSCTSFCYCRCRHRWCCSYSCYCYATPTPTSAATTTPPWPLLLALQPLPYLFRHLSSVSFGDAMVPNVEKIISSFWGIVFYIRTIFLLYSTTKKRYSLARICLTGSRSCKRVRLPRKQGV